MSSLVRRDSYTSPAGKGCCTTGSAVRRVPFGEGQGPSCSLRREGAWSPGPRSHVHVGDAPSHIPHPEPRAGAGDQGGCGEQKGPLECPCLPGCREGRSSSSPKPKIVIQINVGGGSPGRRELRASEAQEHYWLPPGNGSAGSSFSGLGGAGRCQVTGDWPPSGWRARGQGCPGLLQPVTRADGA